MALYDSAIKGSQSLVNQLRQVAVSPEMLTQAAATEIQYLPTSLGTGSQGLKIASSLMSWSRTCGDHRGGSGLYGLFDNQWLFLRGCWRRICVSWQGWGAGSRFGGYLRS